MFAQTHLTRTVTPDVTGVVTIRAIATGALALVACQGANPTTRSRVPARVELPTVGAVVVDVPEAEDSETDELEPPPIHTTALIAQDSWPTFHGSSSRSGLSSAPGIERPRVAWQAKVGIQSWLNSPLVLGDVVFVPSSGDKHNAPDARDGVYALDLKTGTQLWFSRLPRDANGLAATPRHLVVTCDDGATRALDPRTGGQQWAQGGEGKVYSHPLVLDDLVVVGDAGGYLRAYALASGEPRWTTQLRGAIRGGAASDGNAIFAVSEGGEAIALTRDGRELWRDLVWRPAWDGAGPDVPIEVYSPPVVGERALFIPFARDTYYPMPALLALDKGSGRMLWRASGAGQWGNIRSTPALVGDMLVYGEPYSGDVVGISAKDGQMVHRKKVGRCTYPQWSSPAAARDLVYVPRFAGSVYAIEPITGVLRWELYLGDSARLGAPSRDIAALCDWKAPAYALYSPAALAPDGTLLVGSAEGLLYAVVDAGGSSSGGTEP